MKSWETKTILTAFVVIGLAACGAKKNTNPVSSNPVSPADKAAAALSALNNGGQPGLIRLIGGIVQDTGGGTDTVPPVISLKVLPGHSKDGKVAALADDSKPIADKSFDASLLGTTAQDSSVIFVGCDADSEKSISADLPSAKLHKANLPAPIAEGKLNAMANTIVLCGKSALANFTNVSLKADTLILSNFDHEVKGSSTDSIEMTAQVLILHGQNQMITIGASNTDEAPGISLQVQNNVRNPDATKATLKISSVGADAPAFKAAASLAAAKATTASSAMAAATK